MGIPYSREINAAFEEVTPLVAAGFKVLKTTRNISILLAAIQVVTVVSLVLILFVLLAILYSVNPDLEAERQALISPFFRRLAHTTFFGIVEGFAASLVGFGGFVAIGMLLMKSRKPDELQIAAEDDAETALEDENVKEKENKGKEGGKKKKKGKKGKGDEKVEEKNDGDKK